MKDVSRRALLAGLPASLASTLKSAPKPLDLLAIAEAYVKLAEAGRANKMWWGRLGGSEEERASARLLAEQLTPAAERIWFEAFHFSAERPTFWQLQVDTQPLASAMPVPIDGRLPEGQLSAPLRWIGAGEDWEKAAGRWAFLQAPSIGSVHEGKLFDRAAGAGAAGFIFSLPTPGGTWRVVTRAEDPNAVLPIPCFSVDATDGAHLLEAATRDTLIAGSIAYERTGQRDGTNVVAHLPGQGKLQVALFAHMDGYYSGALDNASGLATLVGLAQRIRRLNPRSQHADFWFVGTSASLNHEAGMRAFLDSDIRRALNLNQAIFLDCTDATGSGSRTAYLGTSGWPEVRRAMKRLMQPSPALLDDCFGDQRALCERKQLQARSFCLTQTPPSRYTDHDTLDKLSADGLQRSVEFFMRLLQATSAVG